MIFINFQNILRLFSELTTFDPTFSLFSTQKRRRQLKRSIFYMSQHKNYEPIDSHEFSNVQGTILKAYKKVKKGQQLRLSLCNLIGNKFFISILSVDVGAISCVIFFPPMNENIFLRFFVRAK